MKTLYLCGAGNPEGIRLALAVNRVHRRWDRLVVLDDDGSKHGTALLDVEIAGPFDLLERADPAADEVVNLVARTTAGRRAARRRIADFGIPLTSLIHPAVDTSGVTFGNEVTVYSNSTVSANSTIGDESVVFTGAIVGHGCRLGRGCVVAPGAVINARVALGEGVYVGTNASILPELEIGDWATIGTCSAVIENVAPGATVMGVPARVLMMAGDKPAAAPPPAPTPAEPAATAVAGAPRSATEKALAALWVEMLDLESVGIHDNFFELGADSILAVQLIGKAGQAGIDISVRQLLDHPTIAALARVAVSVEVVAVAEAPVEGDVPLTPVQQWYLEQSQPAPQYYNQTMLVQLPSGTDPGRLEAAFGAALVHHDALRMRFHQRDGRWLQSYDGSDGSIPFSRVDLSVAPTERWSENVAEAVDRAQASLDLAGGPIARAMHIRGAPDGCDRLLLLAHHLVIDGVSWRVLLEDLETGYRQSGEGKPIALPPKTASFQSWANGVGDHAKSGALGPEVDGWLAAARNEIAPIPRDLDGGANTEASTGTVRAALSEPETSDLLRRLPAAYDTRINDVLLTALAQGLSAWTGHATLGFDLEGHGREDLGNGLDVSRTVGWFTSIYPVMLAVDSTRDARATLLDVREQLGAIPRNGIGYGLLRYLGQDRDLTRRLAALPRSEIQFNYLGQFDQMFRGSSLFSAAPEPPGAFARIASPLQTRPYLLEILGMVVGGRFTIQWLFSENVHRRSTVEQLADAFLSRLRSFISDCPSERFAGRIPP